MFTRRFMFLLRIPSQQITGSFRMFTESPAAIAYTIRVVNVNKL